MADRKAWAAAHVPRLVFDSGRRDELLAITGSVGPAGLCAFPQQRPTRAATLFRRVLVATKPAKYFGVGRGRPADARSNPAHRGYRRRCSDLARLAASNWRTRGVSQRRSWLRSVDAGLDAAAGEVSTALYSVFDSGYNGGAEEAAAAGADVNGPSSTSFSCGCVLRAWRQAQNVW
ncbi:hypothetical protein BCR34DRAFT_233884 [Clohesyomyces aquaticus]|uniref:Uncharacterized protein n=1 Tax=Clohesyomyces aquaticus TaxID=1231657 RepID=A0A1Y1ZW15_9PLEO|nr:hypothetical protein BCR34DRAFT_233884 [Clohesyomyces aquaticus]